jgi:type 1 glutamine amidotransferase/sugar phosphate isomerase/epimerase
MTSLHASVPYANYAIYSMGVQTGTFETYFTNDTLAFTRDILQQFDGIVLNNTVGVLFENAKMRQALLDYVYGGGGIMGIHGGAGATFVQYPVYDQFPEFGAMMGGYENGGHPWKTHEFINMIVDEPGHPINLGFEVKDFDISDEIYQYTDPYSRDHVRVLLSVNTEKSDMSPERRFLPERKMDDDFPVSWARSYGKGRVFNTSLGHHPHINWDLRILSHNFRAILYILGDLPAPATPNNKLTASILAQEKLGWRLGLTAWTFKDLTLMETIDKAAELGIWYMDGLNVQKVSPELDKNFDHNLSREELMMIRRKLLSKGVAITNFYIHDIPADEKECERIFEFGRLMGFENFIAEPKPEALSLIDKYCQKYNIGLAIHNHGPDLSPFYWDPKVLLKSIEGRSNMIGVCGDLGYWQRNGIDPANAIKLIGKKLRTIQVHDLNVVSKEGHDVPWGTGKSNLKEVFELLADKGLKPTLIGLEYSYNWGNSLPDIQRSKQFFDRTVINIAVNKN